MLELWFKHLWALLYLSFYAIIFGIASLCAWLWRHSKRIVNTYPKTLLLIVCIAFVADHFVMMVYYRTNAEKQNIRFDSLAALKDSIQNSSTFDSGYAKGLVDGNQFLKNTNDGFKQEESIIHRP